MPNTTRYQTQDHHNVEPHRTQDVGFVVEGGGDGDETEESEEDHHEHGVDDDDLGQIELGLPGCDGCNSLKIEMSDQVTKLVIKEFKPSPAAPCCWCGGDEGGRLGRRLL